MVNCGSYLTTTLLSLFLMSTFVTSNSLNAPSSVPRNVNSGNHSNKCKKRSEADCSDADLRQRLFINHAHMQLTLDLMATMVIEYFNTESKILETFAFSPLSIQSTLMMLMLGTRGATRQEISDALYLSQLTDTGDSNATFTKSHEIYGESVKSLIDDPNLSKILNIANQVFVKKELVPASTFELALKQYHASRLAPIDFAGDSMTIINDWVSKQTNGLIENFLASNPSPSSLLLAINALQYSGEWQFKFNPLDTETDARFRRTNGALAKVDMMVSKLPVAYAYNAELKTTVIELPYRTQRLGMFLLLPDESTGIFSLVKTMNETVLTQLITSMRKDVKDGVNIRLPKFTISSAPRMTSILRDSLGIRSLFTPGQADLSGMFLNLNNSEQIGSGHVDDFLHKVILTIDEKGTIGAAASSAVVERLGSFTGSYFEADHPFMYFLTDKQSGLILFAGVYAGPETASSSASSSSSPTTSAPTASN